MAHDSSVNEHGNNALDLSLHHPNNSPANMQAKDTFSASHNENVVADAADQKSSHSPTSERQQNLFMIFITLTQLVQMIPLGAGINSSLAIGEALGASHLESVWIVASYPLTQGSFVLIGTMNFFLLSFLTQYYVQAMA